MKIRMQSLGKNIPTRKLIVKEGEKHLWDRFKDHHYMDGSLPNSCVFYTFYWVKDNEEILVGCCGVLLQIAKFIKARRFTRVVVLPEYQGLGFGSKIINSISFFYKDSGIDKMYISTFHPRLGEFLTHSPLWSESYNNMVEFKTNKEADKGPMKGLRDGAAMYRYNFTGKTNYNLVDVSPLRVLELKRNLKELKKNDNFHELQEYKDIVKELNSYSIKEVDVPIKSLSVNDEKHIIRKEEHKKMFRPKRKILSTEERKKLKELKKKEKKEKEST